MSNNTSNPTALGYMLLFITGWLISMVSAGWFGEEIPGLGNYMAAYGGGAMFVVGILLYKKSASLDMLTLMGMGVYFTIIGVNFLHGELLAEGEMGFGGWFNLTWALYFLMLWLAGRGAGSVRPWFLLALGLTLLSIALSYWIAPVLYMVGGYLGLLASLLAGAIAYTEISDALGGGGSSVAGTM